MSKFSVSDLAADLGISTDDVLGMLRSLEVAVRAPSAPLTDDQAARVRARWERVKRERAAKAAAPAPAPTRRRKAADGATADSAPSADQAGATEAKPKAKSKAKVAEPAPIIEAPKPAVTRRRRAADAPTEPEPVAPAPVAQEPVVAETAPPAPTSTTWSGKRSRTATWARSVCRHPAMHREDRRATAASFSHKSISRWSAAAP